MRMRGLVLAGCLLMGCAVARGQASGDGEASKKVDEFIASEMREQHIPGAALSVVRDGKIIKTRGYGLANVELDVAVKPESIFQTGSVGKQFTATAVMMLVEEGKIAVSDKISKFIADTPATWKEITVRHLLTHTSGIPDYTGEGQAGNEVAISYRKDYTEDEMVQAFEKAPLDFQPGEKWSYSNSGYVILGVIIHKVTGKFYGDFLQERIFQPLEMKATRIISEADIIPNRCAGYELVKGVLKNQEWVAPMLNTTADGALYTNVLDLAKWDAALYTEKLLKRASFEQMWTAVTLNNGRTYPYGFGWDVEKVNGHRLYEHGGTWQGFKMHIARYVDDKLTIILMTNMGSENGHPGKIAHGVAAIYLPEVKAAKADDGE